MEWGASMLRALTVPEPAAGTISANDLAGAWSKLRSCRKSGPPADPVPAINIFWSLLIASHALSSCQTTCSQAAVALLPGPPSSGQSDLSVAYKHCSSALQEPFGHVVLIGNVFTFILNVMNPVRSCHPEWQAWVLLQQLNCCMRRLASAASQSNMQNPEIGHGFLLRIEYFWPGHFASFQHPCMAHHILSA